MTAFSYKVKTIGNACIIRYNRGEAADLKTILDVNYSAISAADRQSVVDYVATIRPDIPYEIA